MTFEDMERADKIAIRMYAAKRGNYRQIHLMDTEDLAQEILAVSLATGETDYQHIANRLSEKGSNRRTRRSEQGMLEVSMADLPDNEYREVYNQMYGAYPDDE